LRRRFGGWRGRRERGREEGREGRLKEYVFFEETNGNCEGQGGREGREADAETKGSMYLKEGKKYTNELNKNKTGEEEGGEA